MKKLAFALMMVAGFTSCDSDDDAVDNPPFEGESKEFTLAERSESGVSGTVSFNENEDGSTTVEFDLEGTDEGSVHPAHIHMGTAAEGGDIVLTFNPITDGESITDVSELDGGEAISYEDLVAYDGYINVHLSDDELEIIVAQTDIGENALTGESIAYDLAGVNDSGVNGTATFEERENGETLVTLSLEGTEEDAEYPAQIRMGALEDASAEVGITLNPVNGTTGMSLTSIANLDGSEEEEGEAISYEALLDYDGYISVQNTEDSEVAQGNMGANTSEE